MNKNQEVFTPSEFNKTEEFKRFKAEAYNSPFTGNLGRETFPTGQEITTQTNSKSKRKTSFADAKTNAQNSIETVTNTTTATTTTLSVSSVVSSLAVTSAVVLSAVVGGIVLTEQPTTPPPVIEQVVQELQVSIPALEIGDTYLGYEITIKNALDTVDYFLTIRGDEHSFVVDMDEYTIKGELTGLTPETQYTLTVSGREVGSEETEIYHSQSFITKATPIPDPQISFVYTTLTDDVDKIARLQYELTIDDVMISETDYTVYAYCGQEAIYDLEIEEMKNNTAVGVLSQIPEGDIRFVVLATRDGETRTIGEDTTNFTYPTGYGGHLAPTVHFGTPTLCDVNTYEVEYSLISNHSNLEVIDQISFSATLEDGTVLAFDESTEKTGKVRFEDTAGTSLSVDLSAQVGYTETYSGANRNAASVQTLQTPIELKLRDVIVGLSSYDYSLYEQVQAEFIWHAGERAYVQFGDAANGTTVMADSTGYDTKYPAGILEYDATTNTSYAYSLVDANGQEIAAGGTVDLQPISGSDYSYTFSSTNTGDWSITYGDGTYNFYTDVGFESDNPDIYYDVILDSGNYVFRSQERIAICEDLPIVSGGYGLVYGVYVDVAGVRYRLGYTSPSGTIDPTFTGLEAQITTGTTTGEETVDIGLNSVYIYDFTKSYLLVDGVQLSLSSVNFTKNDNMARLEASVPIDNTATSVVLYVAVGTAGLEEISQTVTIKGDWYIMQEIIVK